MENKDDKAEGMKDLASAKHDLLMRFIKDQESLQTSQANLKLNHNDTTFDILDGLMVPREISRGTHDMAEPSDLTDTVSENFTEHGIARPKSKKLGVPVKRGKSCIMTRRTCRATDNLRSQSSQSNIDMSEGNVVRTGQKVRPKSSFKLDSTLNPPERPRSPQKIERLPSAPSLSLGVDARHFVRPRDINVLDGKDFKARKQSSLSIVVPTDTEIKPSLSRRSGRRHSLTRVPLNGSSVGISAVDVELFDKTVSSLAASCTMIHLPPIASKTTQAPPSTL